jgi:hypothetical protein
MASARASVAQPKITTPKIPQTPMGTTPITPEENLAAVQGAMAKGSAAPKTILQQVTQAPEATVAAQDFARKQNPAAALSELVQIAAMCQRTAEDLKLEN